MISDARCVVDGQLVTSQGVSAVIDMALWLVGPRQPGGPLPGI